MNRKPLLKRLTDKIGKRTLIVAGVLVALRAALPWGVKQYINHALAEHPVYGGHVDDVDLHLWRGAYSLNKIKIVKKDHGAAVPFAEIPALHLSLAWRELFHGNVVADLDLERPRVDLVDQEKPASAPPAKAEPLHEWLRHLVPFRLAEFTVDRGEVHFRNPAANPPIDASLRELRVELKNLTNSRKLSEDQFAHLKASGVTVGNGRFELTMSLNPNAKSATFDLDARLLGLELTALNPVFKKYGKLDFEKGVGDIVVELAASGGRVRGYVKPLFKQLQVFALKKEIERDHDSIFRIAWEAIAGAVTGLFKNHPKDQLATRIPIDGKLEHPETSVWPIVGGVLRNAFVSAFSPFYDQSISLKTR